MQLRALYFYYRRSILATKRWVSWPQKF